VLCGFWCGGVWCRVGGGGGVVSVTVCVCLFVWPQENISSGER